MSSKRKGERMRAVKALETTVGGFFSGSLNRCCTWKGGARDQTYAMAWELPSR